MRCGKCGNNNVQGAKNCPQCGAVLEEAGQSKKPCVRSNKTVMLASLGYILFIAAIFILIVLRNSDQDDVQPVTVANYNSVAQKLSVTVTPINEWDSQGKNKIVTVIENKSPYMVFGEVLIKLLDADKKVVASDTVFFPLLNPGESTTVPSWLAASGQVSVEREVFVQEAVYPIMTDAGAFEKITSLPADGAATEALRSYMRLYFGGTNGKPTSWYNMIDTITVYRDGSERIAVVKTNVRGAGNFEALNGLQTSVLGFAADSNNAGSPLIRVDVFDSEGFHITSKVNPRI